MRESEDAMTRRKVWYLESYVDETGGEHVRRLPGVRFGRARFGRVRVMWRDVLGRVVWGKIRPASLRSRAAHDEVDDNVD